MTPQEQLNALRERAAKEGKLNKLQEAVFTIAEQLIKPSEMPWIKAKDLKPGAKFTRKLTSGLYLRVTPAGPILNSSMVQEVLADGKIFVVNLGASRTSFFFIKGDEDVQYV